jgi:hypothetical protein
MAQAVAGLDGRRITAGTQSLISWEIQGSDTTESGRVTDVIRVVRVGGRSVLQRIYRTERRESGVRLDSLIDDAVTLAPVTHRSRSAQNAELITFAPRAVSGVIRRADGDSTLVKAEVPAVVYNASSFDLVLRAAPLREGLTLAVPSLLPTTGTVISLTAKVGSREIIGGRSCWRVEAVFAGMPVTFWIADVGRQLCLQIMRPVPGMAMVLAPSDWRARGGR